jgi:hypothetical protein
VKRSRLSWFERVARVTVVLALAPPARPLAAAEPAREQKVALAVSACPASFEAPLRRILALELGALLDESRSAASRELESIEIACEVESARITARSRGGVEVVHDELRFDAFPGDAAPRAVGLAALEALRAADPTLTERIEASRAKAESVATPSAAGSARRAIPAPPARDEQAEPSRRQSQAFVRVTLGGLVRSFLGEPATTSAGARLELSRRFSAPWDAGLDLDATFARRTVSLGTVHATLLSTAAWFGPRAGNSTWSATAGVGARVGLALLRGAPHDAARGRDSTRPVAGPLLVARGDGAIGALALALGLEGGLVLAGAEGLAEGRPVTGFKGGWVAVSSNVGLRF